MWPLCFSVCRVLLNVLSRILFSFLRRWSPVVTLFLLILIYLSKTRVLLKCVISWHIRKKPFYFWRGRNEVTETSGRLQPLWPQNVWLQTPRNTDYRHARQDRWIQTELALTLAKNATKPNPFEIIPLQTAKKENNWKTEEALVLAAVTVETERIKGSDPWCLWWWFFKYIYMKHKHEVCEQNL